MIKKTLCVSMLSLLLLFSLGIVQAADIGAGKSRSITCRGCHGADGNSSNSIWPNLAGQNAAYLTSQIKAFRDGSRKDPMMKSMVASLSDADAENLGAYFASLSTKSAGGNKTQAKQGKDKYQTCIACHGQNGEGVGVQPKLAGQQPRYTVKQLKDFKSGKRVNSIMKGITTQLSEDDMKALAAYLGTL